MSVVWMPTPGAETSGNVVGPVRPQEVGPRLLKLAIASVPSTAPTENASGLFAGLALVLALAPKLPAANTGRIPAAVRTARSGSNVRSQPGFEDVQELLTTFGASGVAGLRSGSTAHW